MKLYVVTYDSDLTIDIRNKMRIKQQDIFIGLYSSLLAAKAAIDQDVPDDFRPTWPSDGWTFAYKDRYSTGDSCEYHIKEYEFEDKEFDEYKSILVKYQMAAGKNANLTKELESLKKEVEDLKKKLVDQKDRYAHEKPEPKKGVKFDGEW